MESKQNPRSPLPPPPTDKLRLMCSYGGQIITRPNSTALLYLGGETRIVAISRRTTPSTLSTLTTHLSSSLQIPHPFFIKYQLPPHNSLDSLISLSTDDDVLLMLEEVERAVNSRLRLFLFPLKRKEKPVCSPLDSWFSDALKGVKLGRGEDGEDVGGLDNNNNNSNTCDSIVLETNSSFGSTASSTSNSNFPSSVGLIDSNLSENRVASTTNGSNSTAGIYQDTDGYVSSMSNTVSSNPLKSENLISSTSCSSKINKTAACGYTPSPQLAQPHPQPQQELQFVPVGYHYVPHYPTNMLPISSYYSTQYPPQAHYLRNQPYPVYVMPMNQKQPYPVPMQRNLIIPGNNPSNHLPLQHNTAMVHPQVAYAEVTTLPLMDLSTEPDKSAPVTPPLVHVPPNQTQQQLSGVPQMHITSQSIDVNVSSMESANYGNKERDDELAYAQIYKSQPPPPLLPSQYQTMTKETTVKLPEALTKNLHMDNDSNQQIGTSITH